MELQELIESLSAACHIEGDGGALETACRAAEPFADRIVRARKSAAFYINGKSDEILLFDAHIDEVGFTVTFVTDDGFLKVAPYGAIDSRLLAAQPVRIFGKKTVNGVFCSTPPHLSKGDDTVGSVNDICIDTGIRKGAKETIPLGSRVFFASKPKKLLKNRVGGKSLDNRAGVAALIEAARLIKQKGVPPKNVCFLLSDSEEVGLRGAKTAAFGISPVCAVAVDVSFGDGPNLPKDETAPLGSGTMIGLSPSLDKGVSDKLTALARDGGIRHTFEVMGGTTSTNADAISLTKGGVPTGLLSIPLRGMHTPFEVIDTRDVSETAKLLASFAAEMTGD